MHRESEPARSDVGWHLSPGRQPVGQVEQRVAGVLAVAAPPMTFGIPLFGLLSHNSSKGPILTIAAARYWPISSDAWWIRR